MEIVRRPCAAGEIDEVCKGRLSVFRHFGELHESAAGARPTNSPGSVRGRLQVGDVRLV